MTRCCIALAVLGLLTLGCTQPKVDFSQGPREYVATDYDTVLKKWTRNNELIKVSELNNVLEVTATYESWDFRWAYVIRYAEDYRLTIDQRRALLERTLAETLNKHEFYVTLYAEKYKWGNLVAEDPAWIVRLIDDEGTETAPNEINPIKKPGAIELTYFPYTSPWRHAYRISFPLVRGDGRPTISPAARWFGLRFAGAQGNEELIWQIQSVGDLNEVEAELRGGAELMDPLRTPRRLAGAPCANGIHLKCPPPSL